MVEIDNPWVIAVGTGVILVFLQLILSHYFQSVREWIARNTWVQTGLISLIVASAVGLVMSERPDTESRIALVAAELAKNHALALKGEDGVDGNDGVNGKDGVAGKDGMAGKDGLDGKEAPEPDIVLIAEELVRNHAPTLKGEDGVDGFAPDGAVVAFLNSCDDYENWDPYDKAAGRVIVGVGQGLESKFRFEETAGAETHKLTKLQMPAHNHRLEWIGRTLVSAIQSDEKTMAAAGDHFGMNIDPPRVVRSGLGRSFGIMPPYIALYFCKYEGT